MTRCICRNDHCPVHGRGGPIKPDGFAYRYADNALRFNHGERVNGCDPMEAIPYYLGEPVVKGIPAEPGVVHVFREKPSRITARREDAAWVLYEYRFDRQEWQTLCFRPDWESAYLTGRRMVELLDGKTVGDAEMKGKFVP